MKKFGFATVVAGALATAVLGLAVPAQAAPVAAEPVIAASVPQGIDRHDWLDTIHPKPRVPQVDTTVKQSR